MKHFDSKISRRDAVRLGALGVGGVAAGSLIPRHAFSQTADMQSVPPEERKLLFVLTAHGGGSIIDSFLPIAESQVGSSANTETLNCFPDAMIEELPNSGFRYVRSFAEEDYLFYEPAPDMGPFLRNHGQDMAVICHDVSSVNHNVGQARSLNGAGINNGRTLMEAMALRYGGALALPNCNMGTDGFIEHGTDPAIPLRARHEVISSPLTFAMGTHGFAGLPGMPSASLIDRARGIREDLDRESVFGRTFARSPRLRSYLEQRSSARTQFEPNGLIEKLLLIDPATASAAGLQSSPIAAELLTRFENIQGDSSQAQAALAFLLAYHGLSSSVTFGFSSNPILEGPGGRAGLYTTPLSFDFSHNMHRVTQNIMWGRISALLDTFIALLKEHDYMGDPALGKMWDRSVVYIATEFGRTKTRPSGASEWSSGHDLNNGSVIISPLVRGNRVYGGVNPSTGMTFGFDRESGEADPNSVHEEALVYGALAHALDIEYPGRLDCPALVRS